MSPCDEIMMDFLQTVEGSVRYYLYRLDIVLLAPTRTLSRGSISQDFARTQ